MKTLTTFALTLAAALLALGGIANAEPPEFGGDDCVAGAQVAQAGTGASAAEAPCSGTRLKCIGSTYRTLENVYDAAGHLMGRWMHEYWTEVCGDKKTGQTCYQTRDLVRSTFFPNPDYIGSG